MFVIELMYNVPAEDIEEFMPQHVEWLTSQFDQGVFLASGRRVPWVGGIILAASVGRERLEAIAAADPFVVNGVADCTIIEFEAGRTAPGLERLRDLPAA